MIQHKRGFGNTDDNSAITQCKRDFPDNTIYEKPMLIFLTLSKIAKINLLEQEIKCFIATNPKCTKYEFKNNTNNIREYFYTTDIEGIMPQIKEIIKKYQ